MLHYVAIDRWLAYVKNKLSAVNEWVKKRRERRKVSGEGQTYDLPKNGNLLFDFFPSLYSKWASLETQGQLVGTK